MKYPLKEAFLHFIWQFQLFKKQNLTLHSGEILNVIKPGHLNHNSGPDFSQAHVHYDELDFYGHVEIHLKSSDWNKHNHQKDPAYNNVILHVVLEHDEEIKTLSGHGIPTLELRGRIPLNLYNNYENLLKSNLEVACEAQLEKVNKVILLSMLDRVLVERLEQKSSLVKKRLEKFNNDWEETVFATILNSFGFKRNVEGYSELSERISFKMIKRHCQSLTDVEALLFGTAGFLKGKRPGDAYFNDLCERYKILKMKAGMDSELDPVIWKFFRLRPANFPTLRLAQFAAYIFKKEHLLSEILEIENPDDVKSLFKTRLSDYWQNHYKFSDEKVKGVSEMGESSIEGVIINAIIPLWVAYSALRNREDLLERSLRILEDLSSENNKITRFWKNYDFPNNNAYDSQALIQLYKNYCMKRNCLECNIGVTLVREL